MVELEQFDALNDPERRLITLTSEGLSVDRIAWNLDIKHTDLKSHTKRLVKKLGLERQGGILRVVSSACQVGFFREVLDLRDPSRNLSIPEILTVYLVTECCRDQGHQHTQRKYLQTTIPGSVGHINTPAFGTSRL
jgi:DNA-binding CsgD family transcriptional regulator